MKNIGTQTSLASTSCLHDLAPDLLRDPEAASAALAHFDTTSLDALRIDDLVAAALAQPGLPEYLFSGTSRVPPSSL